MQKNKVSQSEKTLIMVEGAAMVALATVLSYIRVWKMPWGGSVTLMSMLPIMIYSLRRGLKLGFVCSFVFSLVQLGQGIADGLFGWGLTPGMLVACIFIDYVLAFTVLGVAGLFRTKGMPGRIMGITVAILGRFVFHFISGCLIWQSYGELWTGFATDNTYLYSLLYNGAYMLPELVFSLVGAVVLLNAPVVKKEIVK